MAKPALAILVGNALSKAGMKKKQDDAEPEMEQEDDELVMIAKDLIAAIEAKDAESVAELLKEAIHCCETQGE